MHDGTPKTLCSTRVENRCHRFNGMSSSDIISVYSPATGEHVGDVPAHTADFTRKAFAAARDAQKQWVSTSLQHRKAVMLRLHDMVLERQSELMDVIQSETGKNRASAFDEVLDVAITARHYAYAAPRMLRTRRAAVQGKKPHRRGLERRWRTDRRILAKRPERLRPRGCAAI